MPISRRQFMAGTTTAASGLIFLAASDVAAPRFATRGVILGVRDMETYDWPAFAASAGLTTLATHVTPSEVTAFMNREKGQQFRENCTKYGIEIEHELHALGDLLPRSLFEKNPEMFRMDEAGNRVGDYNLCVHSVQALEVASENAAQYTRLLPSTTGRYFYWIDDAMPMCRCPECRAHSDSDQALILENHLLGAIRTVDSRATLAHLAYVNTLDPPTTVKPDPGVFLEFAPIERRYDRPLSARDTMGAMNDVTHGRLLDALDANLEWFGAEDAQVLEYWLDVSRFSGWKRENVSAIPWRDDVFRDDVETYARRGIRHVTTFAVWIDRDYVVQYGVEPVAAYGAGLNT